MVRVKSSMVKKSTKGLETAKLHVLLSLLNYRKYDVSRKEAVKTESRVTAQNGYMTTKQIYENSPELAISKKNNNISSALAELNNRNPPMIEITQGIGSRGKPYYKRIYPNKEAFVDSFMLLNEKGYGWQFVESNYFEAMFRKFYSNFFDKIIRRLDWEGLQMPQVVLASIKNPDVVKDILNENKFASEMSKLNKRDEIITADILRHHLLERIMHTQNEWQKQYLQICYSAILDPRDFNGPNEEKSILALARQLQFEKNENLASDWLEIKDAVGHKIENLDKYIQYLSLRTPIHMKLLNLSRLGYIKENQIKSITKRVEEYYAVHKDNFESQYRKILEKTQNGG